LRLSLIRMPSCKRRNPGSMRRECATVDANVSVGAARLRRRKTP
jgi:hypothetical protein